MKKLVLVAVVLVVLVCGVLLLAVRAQAQDRQVYCASDHWPAHAPGRTDRTITRAGGE